MTIRTIQLHKSDTAIYGDISYTASGSRWGPIAPLIRRLLAEGLVAPNDIIEVRRGDLPCQQPRPAIRWAEIDIIDDARKGLVQRKACIGPHVRPAPAMNVGTPAAEGRFQGDRPAVQADGQSPG